MGKEDCHPRHVLAGPLLEKQLSWLAWAMEFLNIPHILKGRQREGASGGKRRKTRNLGEKKGKGGNEIENRHTRPPSPPYCPPSPNWANQGPPCSLSPWWGGKPLWRESSDPPARRQSGSSIALLATWKEKRAQTLVHSLWLAAYSGRCKPDLGHLCSSQGCFGSESFPFPQSPSSPAPRLQTQATVLPAL